MCSMLKMHLVYVNVLISRIQLNIFKEKFHLRFSQHSLRWILSSLPCTSPNWPFTIIVSFLTIAVLKCKFIDSSSHRVFCPSVRYSIFSNATFCLSDYYDHVYFICKKSNCEAIIEYSSACTVYHNYSDTAINVQQWVRQPLCGMCYNIVVNLLLERYIP